MSSLRVLSASEQVAQHLREQLFRRAWTEVMPGGERLSRQLGVGRMTVEAALIQLEKEGLLVHRGRGRQRRIVLPENLAAPALQVQILPYNEDTTKLNYMLDLLYSLGEAGHAAKFASKSLLDMDMDVERVARFVKKTETDAWVICAGSLEVLEWFAEQPVPAFALFGRRQPRIAGAGPDKLSAQNTAVSRLIKLGHRRIAMLVREDRRKPLPGLLERLFLEQLVTAGIPSGPYNLPDWEDNREGFHLCLDSLFQHTPPSALLIDGLQLFVATQQHLARRGIIAPEHVSLICLDPDPAFAWCEPAISHIHWDAPLLVRSIVRWANNVAHGKDDRRRFMTKAEFIEGGTIGPAPES